MTVIQQLAPRTDLSVTIDISEDNDLSTASGTLSVGSVIVGLMLPATWTAAAVSLLVSHDGGTTYGIPVDPATGAYFVTGTLTVSNSNPIYVPLDPVMMAGVTNLKVKSGTEASGTAQTSSDKTITIATRPVF